MLSEKPKDVTAATRCHCSPYGRLGAPEVLSTDSFIQLFWSYYVPGTVSHPEKWRE